MNIIRLSLVFDSELSTFKCSSKDKLTVFYAIIQSIFRNNNKKNNNKESPLEDISKTAKTRINKIH